MTKLILPLNGESKICHKIRAKIVYNMCSVTFINLVTELVTDSVKVWGPIVDS